MELSKRLKAVAEMVSDGCRLADVGTDHAYVPIELCRSGRIPYAIAVDVNPGPLKRAEAHIKAYQMEEIIDVRLSDGLTKLRPGEVDSVLIAGMGGLLTVQILEKGKILLSGTDIGICSAAETTADGSVTAEFPADDSGPETSPKDNRSPRIRELILQPQSDVREVRKWLCENGWRIVDEHVVAEEGKIYPMMRAVSKKSEQSEADRLLLEHPDEKAASRLIKKYGKSLLNHVLNGLTKEEMRELEWRFGTIMLRKRPKELLPALERELEIQFQILLNLNAGKGRKSKDKLQYRKREVENDLLMLTEAKMICILNAA